MASGTRALRPPFQKEVLKLLPLGSNSRTSSTEDIQKISFSLEVFKEVLPGLAVRYVVWAASRTPSRPVKKKVVGS